MLHVQSLKKKTNKENLFDSQRDYGFLQVCKLCANKIEVKNAVFWDVMLCGSCKNPRFAGA
jgi:Leu/Phe-tRNA-protein transferase